MGYYVDIETIDVLIPTDKVKDCLQAINDLQKPEMLNRYASGGSMGTDKTREYWYGFVNGYPKEGCDDLVTALKHWRYDAEKTEAGVVIKDFSGEKWADDIILYVTIAPFVANKGLILCTGEDDCQWGYIFDNGKIYQGGEECHYNFPEKLDGYKRLTLNSAR